MQCDGGGDGSGTGGCRKKWKRWRLRARLRVQSAWDPRPGQATCGASDNDKDFYDSLKSIEACTGLLLIVSDRSCRHHGRCHLGLSRASSQDLCCSRSAFLLGPWVSITTKTSTRPFMTYPDHKSGIPTGKVFVCNKNAALKLLERNATGDRRLLQGRRLGT